MKNADTVREDQVIASLLGDAPTPATLRSWLASAAGRRTVEEYRALLAALDALYVSAHVQRAPGVRRVIGSRPDANRRLVYVAAMPTPIGRITIAASDRGLLRLSFRGTDASIRAELRRFGADVVEAPHRLRAITMQLESYFAGKRRAFELPLDLSITTPFQRRVLMATRRVPAGSVVSYGDIARRIGQPRASRAVGQALGRNPVPIVIPCHRVVAGGGRIGGYTGGLAIKRKLLAIEGAAAFG